MRYTDHLILYRIYSYGFILLKVWSGKIMVGIPTWTCFYILNLPRQPYDNGEKVELRGRFEPGGEFDDPDTHLLLGSNDCRESRIDLNHTIDNLDQQQPAKYRVPLKRLRESRTRTTSKEQQTSGTSFGNKNVQIGWENDFRASDSHRGLK